MRLGPVELHVARASHGNGSMPEQPAPTEEIGQNVEYGRGTTYFGYVLPEYNAAMAGKEGIRNYDKMRRGDAQVKASLKMVKSPILTAQYYMEPLSDRDLDKEVAEFVEWNLHNMHRPFIDFVREGLSFLDFGCYAFEKVYEYMDWRPLPTEEHPKPNRRRVAKLKDLVPRHPIKYGGYTYNYEGKLADVLYGATSVPIPIDRLIYFALDSEADDPYGTSVLRSAYKHWYHKEAFYRVDGVQKERHGVGVPRVRLLAGYSKDDVTRAHELGRNIRANEMAYIVQLPNIEVDFVKPEGQLVNALESARHHGLMILENVLVQFLNLGTEESGSRAVGSTQSDAFSLAIRYVLDFMLGVVNTQLIPEIVDYNYLEVDGYPKLRARVLGDEAKLRALSTALSALAHEGIITQGPDVEAWVRDWFGMPAMPPEAANRTVEDRTASANPAAPPPPVKPNASS